MRTKLLPFVIGLAALLSMAWSQGLGMLNSGGHQVIVSTGPSNQAHPQMNECGADAGTAGALTVTFQTPFVTLPNCTVNDEKAVPLACGITAKSLSAVTFSCPTGTTEVIDYCCTGSLF